MRLLRKFPIWQSGRIEGDIEQLGGIVVRMDERYSDICLVRGRVSLIYGIG